ncbi:MAG: ABC transporter substrate-binding protein, partial [Alphaproteobacteria bacterium]|nr:ABC transporter substrate-binding protein [Alphaproteobacteria bacterium]
MKFYTAVAMAAWAATASMAAAQDATIRAAVQESGTVNWELDTIKHYGLDTENGFTLDVQGMAGGDAAQIAFQGGAVDMIVSDWIWVARQRAAGEDFIFIPYSRAVGGMLVPEGSTAQTLEDMKG